MKESSLRLFVNPASQNATTSRVLLEPPRAAAQPQKAQPSIVRLVVDVAEVTTPAKSPVQPVALEAAIIAALDIQPSSGERAAEAFRRKEYAVGELFARLSIVDALHLHRRLAVKDPSDPISIRFARLVAGRQTRLLNFLGDARRRAALARSR